VIGLDTNILIRFLAQDEPIQSPKANAVMASLTVGEPGWIGLTSIVELVWVMTSQKRLDRRGIATLLSRLLTREEIVIEQASLVQSALLLYRKGNADFADCLIATSAKAAGCLRTLTFDRKAARDAGMELAK
jgi:predicted nucleic-acid-binding protein